MSAHMAKPAGNVTDAQSSSAAKDALGVEGADPAIKEASMAGAETRVERTDFPCSVAQERFWLLDRLDPGNASYNVAVRWRLEGRVLTDVLEQSWLKIIERHEILRSVFLEVEGTAIQRVLPHAQFRLHEINLGTLGADVQQAEADRIGIIEARAPFDLAAGPIIRATLLRLSPTASILLVTTHQVVSDGWSIGVMAREMGIIYQALSQNKPVPLEPLQIQYADYSQWQLEWLKVRGTAAETAYWSKQLAGAKPFRIIPDRARPNMPTSNGAIVSRVLPRELTNLAQSLSADRGATLFAAVFAALCAMLARLTNQTDLVFGTQVSDRDQVELEPMVGQFVNSLILRNNLAGNPTFGEILDNVRETVAQALEYRHIPIERLLDLVKAHRSHANGAAISVNFIFQKTFIQNTSYEDFDLIDMPSLPAGAIYDLNFFMVERPDGWRFSCQYHTDQFEAATAERLLGYYQNVLESAVADPTQRLAALSLCGPNESRLLLGKLNDTRRLYPRDLTLSKLFEAQAERAPHAIAVICGERQLTYSELNASAGRFSTYLRQHGVVADSTVAICLHRSMELAICMLAVLKAGATFVAIQPTDPPRRRDELLAASKAAAIIGRDLGGTHLASVEAIDVEAALGYAGPASVSAPLESEATACLVASAGSSRAPLRMVGISHRSLSNLIYSMSKRPGIGERDVVVATSPIALDRAAFEMFLPLLTGATLVLAMEKDLATGRGLLTLLQRTKASAMYGDAEVWCALMDSGWIGYPALKILCSAQALSPSLTERLSAVGGELWAMYGHPETGIWSAAELKKRHQGFVTIGEPIANTVLYVLDASMQIAPVDAVGELCIGGEGASAATIQSFPDSFTRMGSAELYRTGDLARLRASGQIEYLGRMDHRFMHSGRQVDPAEIECVLLAHPAVAEACVVVPESDVARASDIVAFVVPRLPQATHADALMRSLRNTLTASLPYDLVPQSLIIQESLPYTSSGELDRRLLQSPLAATRRRKGGIIPASETERRLAEIWASMLAVASIESTDNFFELGGHSLLAARMLAQVERIFGRHLNLASLFAAPTLHDFASLLAQKEAREFDFRQVVKIQPHGSKPPLIVINNTGIYYALAKCLGADQPIYSLQLFDPSIRTTDLPETIEEMATRYVELIKRVQSQGPYALVGWCVAGALAFEVAHQLTESREKVSHLFLMDAWIPRYIARLPGLRRVIADYSLRAQFIFADWKDIFTGQQSFLSFVKKRTLVKKMQQLLSGVSRRSRHTALPHSEYTNVQDYDEWLLNYLQRTTAKYEPKIYPGRITLFRSKLEPTGLFFDRLAGWGKFTSSGVDLFMLEGNHFTMFQGLGVIQMANYIKAATDPAASRQMHSAGGLQR